MITFRVSRGMRLGVLAVAGVWSVAGLAAASAAEGSTAVDDAMTSRAAKIPEWFTRFEIARHPGESQALRDLLWQHYSPRPMATLWDEWLLEPSLYPANPDKYQEICDTWRQTLLTRDISPEGYVASYQHQSIAHQKGWPFPFWAQGAGVGWHFSFKNTIGPGWRPDKLNTPDDWVTTDVESLGVKEDGWHVRITGPHPQLQPPAFKVDRQNAPFFQVRWQADKLPARALPYLEWETAQDNTFTSAPRMVFDAPPADKMTYAMIPLYRHPQWNGDITGLRLGIDNVTTGTELVIQAVFSQYDTRHNVNNPSFVSASIDYFHWTDDVAFLRANIERMRLAMRFMETEFGTDKDGIVTVPWVGHEGRTGIYHDAAGKTRQKPGEGVGNNYWDLLPFGQQDSYATIRHYAAALKMAKLEQEIANHPEWGIGSSPVARSAEHWRQQAALGKANGNRHFWNEQTGRFTLGVDADGGQADYGYTFINLEAISYDFATAEHARTIMDWIDGRRAVEGDTAQTTDIYHWRFAPRATTRRNVEHYGWFWNGADGIPFGYQVQDGGAVLGFSYHDVMARLRVNGPDNAARRLEEILQWYREVMAGGGYRAWYDGKTHEGTLQGGGPPGGLGMDQEFFESVLVPQVMLDGFLGLEVDADGFRLKPRLPKAWPGVTVRNVMIKNQEQVLRAGGEGAE